MNLTFTHTLKLKALQPETGKFALRNFGWGAPTFQSPENGNDANNNHRYDYKHLEALIL